MRRLARNLSGIRPEIPLVVIAIGFFLYTMISQRITNIYTACRLDPYNTVNHTWIDSGYSQNTPGTLTHQEIDWCIGKRQSSLGAAWVGPFLWAVLATVVVIGAIFGLLYLMAQYTNWLGSVAGLKPVVFFTCGCSDAHCLHCVTAVKMSSNDEQLLIGIQNASPSRVQDETTDRPRRPWSVLRFWPKGIVRR
jgi:hypothetical protein